MPKRILCGNYFGQMIHQQIRACATRFNAYTSHAGGCTYSTCNLQAETNKHVVAQCPRYTNARERFYSKTGVRINDTTYIDVMAIDYKKLNVDAVKLAKALCALLADVVRIRISQIARKRPTTVASVALPLDSNQRRSIIPTVQLEREPD